MPINFEALRDADARAVLASVVAVAAAGSDDLESPTPCAGWTLTDLLAHMTVQQRGFARAAHGVSSQVADWEPRPVWPDPVRGYTTACHEVLEAFAAPDLAEREFVLPEISTDVRFPAARAVGFHLVDNVVHAWDVAMTLGVPLTGLDSEVLRMALAVARAVPNGSERLRPGAAFAPSLDVPEAAGALEEILLVLGRSPEWTATSAQG